jgi:outer membrane protein TolC
MHAADQRRRPSRRRTRVVVACAVALTLTLLGACGRSPEVAGAPKAAVHKVQIASPMAGAPVDHVTVGSVASDHRLQISSRVASYVRDILVREGDAVHRGQVLARLDAADVDGAVRQSEAGLAAAQAQGRDANEDLDRFQILHASGTASDNDLRKLRLRHDAAQEPVNQARTALDLARAGYNRLLCRHLADEVRLDTPAPPAAAADLDTMTDCAMAARAELRGLDEAAAGVMRQADAARDERLPQVALVGGRGGVNHTVLQASARNFVGVTMNWTLCDPGLQPRHAELQAKAQALREQREQLAGLIALQVRQAWLRCEKSRQRHDVAGTARESAEESLRVARDRHLPGLATQTEVLAAESQRTQAEGNLANAEFDRVSSALALRLDIGEL